jgi:hypothetical protein
MEPVTWSAAIAGILGLLAALPKIIGYVEQVVAAVTKWADAAERSARAKEVANAIEHAKITKDTSHLEDIFNPKPK